MAPTPLRLDEDRCYQALVSRDRRFDGQFIAAITSTGIYCRPSCPAPVRPKRSNVRVYATAAAAQQAGFRSCKRCRPDAAPGSPEWDLRGDLVGRAMTLIERGEVDRIGVAGLAESLFVSERHLNRVLNEAVGASPIALARANRANLARILLETTELSVTDTAFAAGFSSVRQFNDTIRAIYDRSPTQLRKAPGARSHRESSKPTDGKLTLRLWLAAREPIDLRWLFDFLAGHGIPGVTEGGPAMHRRSIRIDGEGVIVTIEPDATDGAGVWATYALPTIASLSRAIASTRGLFDLDADPTFIDEALREEPKIARLRTRRPGIRVPGSTDPFEAAIGAIVGQQISVAGARTLLGRLIDAVSDESENHDDELRPFPEASELAEADLSNCGLTGRRVATIQALAQAVANEDIALDAGVDRQQIRRQLLALPGIGPWTADVIAMRGLGDPDVMLASDLVVRRRLHELDITNTQHLSPWRSYAACTLWATQDPDATSQGAAK